MVAFPRTGGAVIGNRWGDAFKGPFSRSPCRRDGEEGRTLPRIVHIAVAVGVDFDHPIMRVENPLIVNYACDLKPLALFDHPLTGVSICRNGRILNGRDSGNT